MMLAVMFGEVMMLGVVLVSQMAFALSSLRCGHQQG